MANPGIKIKTHPDRNVIKTKLKDAIASNPGILRWKLMVMMVPYNPIVVSAELKQLVESHYVHESAFIKRPNGMTTYMLESVFRRQDEAG